MADHIRQQIRQAVVTALTGLTTTGANVFAGRIYPAEETSLPCLLVYTPSEQSEPDTMSMSSRGLARQLDLVVEGLVRASTGLDASLDTIAKEVEVALAVDPTLGGLAKDMFLASSESDLSGEGNKQTGYIRLTFSVETRTLADDPTITI